MNRKALIKIAGFLVILAILLKLFGVVFNGGYWFEKKFIYDRNARLAAFDLETKDRIDVINVGDSLSTSALAPLELFRDYGFTAYNLGYDMQTPVETYSALVTACKTQQIKVALYEVHNLIEHYEDESFPSELVSETLKTEFPFLKFHYVWLKYWKKRSIRKYYKGFLVNDGHDPYTGGEYYDWGSEKRFKMDPIHVFTLRRIADLCRRKGIKLVLYSAASPVCYDDISMHNTMCDLAEELGVDYIDANYDRDKCRIDWSKDTHDNGDHLNLSGSRKMTVYLGDYLSENCDLTDHRGDPDYQEWTDLWASYEETIEEMRGIYYGILEDALGFD